MLEVSVLTTSATSGKHSNAPIVALFKHLLLPIDGSELAFRAFGTGLELARKMGAKVLILHVVPPLHTVAYMNEFLASVELRYSEYAVRSATCFLDKAKDMAELAQVPCTCQHVFGDSPYLAILEAARSHHCDLIVMGTHGWHGMNKLLLGSETQKVLLESSIPVMVCH